MLLAKIVGTVVATRKDPRLVSSKLLVVRPIDPRGKAEGNYLVAFQSNSGDLFTYNSATGTKDLGMGMKPGTSPSIATESATSDPASV